MVLYNIIGWLFQFQILVNLDVLAFVEEIHCKALCYGMILTTHNGI